MMFFFALSVVFFFQAEDGIRDADVTGVQTCALPISQVQVFGGTPHAVRIELNSNALAAKGLTGNDISNALRAANVSSPQGTLSDGQTQRTVDANDALHEPAEFAQLVIAVKNGAPVRLSDVAK